MGFMKEGVEKNRTGGSLTPRTIEDSCSQRFFDSKKVFTTP
jgi:hypothetical protein